MSFFVSELSPFIIDAQRVEILLIYLFNYSIFLLIFIQYAVKNNLPETVLNLGWHVK